VFHSFQGSRHPKEQKGGEIAGSGKFRPLGSPKDRCHSGYMPESANEEPKEERVPIELIALLRILKREPPPDHNFETCLICRELGITQLDSRAEISYGNSSSS
jgi:hypothetical protein